MKPVVRVLALALGLAVMMATAMAQDFPRQAIRIIVPYPPGASADVVTRLVADELKSALGQPVTVENRSGATGLVGVGNLARAPADGYTIGLGNEATHVIVPLLRNRVAYDPIQNFTPLTLAVRTSMVIAVNPELLPVKNLPELIELAKKRPGGVSFGTPGDGSLPHLLGELLRQETGANLIHAPFLGTNAAIQESLAGRLPMVIGPLLNVLEKRDKLRIIAVGDAARVPALPAVPTVSETVPDLVVTGWAGYFAPANLPPGVASKLSTALAAILRKPAVVEAVRKLALEPVGSTPEELGEMVKSGPQRWAPVILKARIQKQD